MTNSNKPDGTSKSSQLNQSFQGFHQQTWSQAIYQLEGAGDDYVIATVLGTHGSSPRATGTKMVISADNIYDTLGGGHLEFKAIEKARELLRNGESIQMVESFNLGATLGQCCGGSVVVMFEALVSSKMRLDIYGAGHVAQALVPILAQLPLSIRWIDSRADIFPQYIPNNVNKIVDEEPTEQAKTAKANSAFLILTHNHQLDFDLTETILKRDDALWLGVIGSDTKAKRFRHRLTHREFADSQVAKMTCPVGLSNVVGKLPMEVAVSIAGQIISLYQSNWQANGATAQAPNTAKSTAKSNKGLQWQQLKNVLMPVKNDTDLASNKTTNDELNQLTAKNTESVNS
ncbi:xanthine dehydrogenase accessory protein XdhC [Colwellia echini]|uniref:Xanthine dehydrogenase accessory protein XdhC n=1 Tax=Colwellia echini TaxID=1982103 RepID=A0ABY3MZI2_9GAMM|nr:xanthine dehydrogenase accessory protein XdhC [Colwellia echini]TYK66645.1 xanthine dehydrogenase accessory protein XdhC [Colwellia echini]